MLQQQLAQATGQQMQTQQQQQTTQVQQLPQATTLQAVQPQVSIVIFFVFPRKLLLKEILSSLSVLYSQKYIIEDKSY